MAFHLFCFVMMFYVGFVIIGGAWISFIVLSKFIRESAGLSPKIYFKRLMLPIVGVVLEVLILFGGMYYAYHGYWDNTGGLIFWIFMSLVIFYPMMFMRFLSILEHKESESIRIVLFVFVLGLCFLLSCVGLLGSVSSLVSKLLNWS